MLNTMLEWLTPIIGWFSGLNVFHMMWAACGLTIGALVGLAVLLKVESSELTKELSWWQDRYRSLNLAREEDNNQAFKAQQELRISLAKAQDSLSEACDKFNDHMARRDTRICKLQDELDMTKKELACTKRPLRCLARSTLHI